MSVFRAIHIGLHRPWLDPIFLVLSTIGLGGGQAALSLLFAFTKSTRRFVIPLLVTTAVSGWLVADGLKALIPRDRPSNLAFAHPQELIYSSSFPSGHTTTAFAVATMLTFLTWNSRFRLLGQMYFLVAALIGFSRIYRGVHWPTDVIGGACCGVASSCLLYLIFLRFGMPIVDSSGDKAK